MGKGAHHQSGTKYQCPTITYQNWLRMRASCYTMSAHNWLTVGGKGIEVCKAWNSFETFLQDMGECPADHCLRRIDKSKNFEPSNCKWVPKFSK